MLGDGRLAVNDEDRMADAWVLFGFDGAQRLTVNGDRCSDGGGGGVKKGPLRRDDGKMHNARHLTHISPLFSTQFTLSLSAV